MYYGDTIAEKAMMRLNAKIKRTYAQAYREMETKLKDYTKKFEEDDKKYREMVRTGKLSQADYDKWKEGKVFAGKRWSSMVSDITTQISNADKTTEKMINGERRAVFQENLNYAEYSIDKDYNFGLTFTIYDSATVTRLIKEDPKLLPDVKVDEEGYKQWSKQLVSSAVTQSIIQGESIPQTAKRIGEKVSSSNANAMTRVARTAMTSAQNGGRIEAMHNAQDMGIKVQKIWIATLDNRTRDAHADLDGQIAEVDEPFESALGEIYFPGDPNANPQNVWNCRCTLGWEYPDYKNQYDTRAAREYDSEEDEEGHTVEVPYMTYSEWKELNNTEETLQEGQTSETEEVETEDTDRRKVVQGKDIIDTWVRRPDEFAFEIDDVINAQGFDGLPEILDADKFDLIAKENQFLAQRGYVAPDTETLEAYRDQLYNGKWYVDCSRGGAMYGQGMYASANFVGEMTDRVKSVSESYSGNGLGYVETFTMRDPKFVLYNEIRREYDGTGISERLRKKLYEGLTSDEALFLDINASSFFPDRRPDWQKSSEAAQRLGEEGREKVMQKWWDTLQQNQENSKRIKEKYENVGVYAAACGYDGIICGTKEQDGVYMVILNRTKCVFRRPE